MCLRFIDPCGDNRGWMKLLFIVDGVFVLNSGRVVLTPGVKAAENLTPGAALRLRRPDGSVADGTVGGFEFLTPNPKRMYPLWILEARREDIPIRTEVWG